MSSIHLDKNGDRVDDIPVDCGEANAVPQNSSDCDDADDPFGEPDIQPRIGDQYQVELPLLTEERDFLSYSEVGHHSVQDFSVGLPIPLTWISCPKHEGTRGILESRRPHCKNVAETWTLCNGDIKPEEESQHLPDEEKISSDEGRLLVPGLRTQSWSDAEKASFVLALYIFEKNFVEVRRFIEIKNMGSILSFFYGDFYGSDKYHKWSEGRKTRSKKCVYGQRIFSGLRQQELLSRLLPKVSEERRSALLEVSKTFGDEKMSLLKYVSSLKNMVGMNILVEAVGIGTGKQDLTGMALEPLRSNQVIPARPEIPAGKACSSLTTTEIIKFLSGDYRLSKARSNDLFWEAVWPRLLARGWHSEQPQNQGYIAGSKHFLVFLVPGVKKFSRRKLVKGDHYFDSVTDVLSKVAKEPGLIELDNEEADGSKNKEEHEQTSERKMEEDENHLPIRQRHCYLQPRTPKRRRDAMKFTIVDTSRADGKVRELRTLPNEVSNMSFSLDCPEVSNNSSLEENTGESDTISTSTLDALVTDSPTAKSGGEKNSPGQDIHTVNPANSKSPASLKTKKDLNDNKKPRKLSKSLLSRKQKQGSVDNVAPISKRCRRLTADSTEEQRDGVIHPSTVPRLENGINSCSSGVRELNENLLSQVSSTSSSKGSPCESMEHAPSSDIHTAEPSAPNTQTQLLIDLNLPQVPPEFENNPLATNSTKEPDNQSIKQDNSEAKAEQQSNLNPRRLSTRYRPPTTRALEAVANGYLDVPRRRKGSSKDGLASRPSQRPRGVVVPNESPSSSVASHVEEAEKGASSSGTDINLNKFHNPPEGTEESVSRQ